MFRPSTKTFCFFGSTRRTRPVLPRSLPLMTTASSSRRISAAILGGLLLARALVGAYGDRAHAAGGRGSGIKDAGRSPCWRPGQVRGRRGRDVPVRHPRVRGSGGAHLREPPE